MILNQKLLGLFGLKWNPFSADLPNEALISNEKIENFCFRVENLVMDGGLALIQGESGQGKSVVLRILFNRLCQLREVKIGTITRPQSRIADFYRELGNIFEIEFRATNRWGGYKALREKWVQHIQSTLLRPILLIDEAQEMSPETLNELRFLSSTHFDSKNILTVVLCGDQRLPEKFKLPDLIPLGSRIKTRFPTTSAGKNELLKTLKEGTNRAGNGALMTEELMEMLVSHASGNYRVLMNMSNELLSNGLSKELHQLDENLFFEVYNLGTKNKNKRETK